MATRAACLLVVLCALPSAAGAQVPAGPEIRIKTKTSLRWNQVELP